MFSFDYIQPRQSDQGRKTRFFRRLYGQTQRVNRRLQDGRTASYTYHYPGILAQLPHVRLGKSVFGVRPGTEGPVLELLESFEEVSFYRFIGWLPSRMWQPGNRKSLLAASSLIAHFGHLSILLSAEKHGGSASLADLIDYGFDAEYVVGASRHLVECGLLGSKPEGFYCTGRGRTVAQMLLPLAERSGAI